VLEPSPVRRAPPCPHFGACGGCQWQHVRYEEQLAAKDRSFRGFLRTRAGIAPDCFQPPIASPAEWGYRNRVGWKVRWRSGKLLLGYFEARSHRIVPITACPIAAPPIQALLDPLSRFLEGFGPARGGLPQVDLQVDARGAAWAVFHLLHPLSAAEEGTLRAFLEEREISGAFLQAGRKETLQRLAGAERMPFVLDAFGRRLSLDVSPGGFVQANPSVNQFLVEEVLRLAPLYEGRAALDACCGAGNFTLPLALAASEVVGVEAYAPAARDARANARANGFSNVRVSAGRLEESLRDLAAAGFRPRFVLLDPPREGAGEALEPLAALAPERILYVSCSPPTLARDLGALGARGYRVEWARMADMFPQTAHVEALTLLVRERS
jgi:23S rRNA (uracil1939-C5)-methyltransferase